MSRSIWSLQLVLLCIAVLAPADRAFCQAEPPTPLLQKAEPVDWWFVFKFNAETFPRPAGTTPTCLFGGEPGGVRKYSKIGQDYAFASSKHPALEQGTGFLGDSTDDPAGATFDEVYNGNLFYVLWNDQF